MYDLLVGEEEVREPFLHPLNLKRLELNIFSRPRRIF